MPRIPRSNTLAEIVAALAQLQRDYECEPDAFASTAERHASERLARVLRVDEALGLVKLVKIQRVRCEARDCGAVVPLDRAAGNFCTWCAAKSQRADESTQREQP